MKTRSTGSSMAIAILVAVVGCQNEGALATGSGTASIGSADAGSSDGSSVTLTPETGSSSADSSGTATASTGSSGSSTSASTTTDGTESTTGEPMAPGRTQGQLVGSGERMSSPSYQMESTLGQPSQLQSTHTSANYRLQGGIVGANGSPP